MNRWIEKMRWQSLGRMETHSEFKTRWELQRNSIPTLQHPPQITFIFDAKPGSTTQENLLAQSYPFFTIEKAFSEGSTADWIAFIKEGDLLNPCALFELAVSSLESPETELWYSHEVIGSHLYSKPNPSGLTLSFFNYIGNFFWIRREALLEYRHLAHQPYSLLLQFFNDGRRAGLLPYFFFYPCEDDLNIRGRGNPKPPKVEGKISIFIPFRDKADWTVKSAQKILAAKGEVPREILLINNRSCEEEVTKVRSAFEGHGQVQVVSYPYPFNYAEIHNWAIENYAKGEYLFFLNNDVFWESEESFDDLAGWASLDWIGTVGIRLHFPDGKLQHAGFKGFLGGRARLVNLGHETQDSFFAYLPHEVFGNTFAACMVSRRVYQKVGGLNPVRCPNGFGDIVFNLECKRRGLHNLYLGTHRAIHLESASRGIGNSEYWEEFYVEKRYASLLQEMVRADLGWERELDSPHLKEQLYPVFESWLRRRFPYLREFWQRSKKRKTQREITLKVQSRSSVPLLRPQP